MAEMMLIDGSTGEGGGQVLRTSLALSMLTGIPVTIDKIRANRSKDGLLRQHLTATRAAVEICGAEVVGDKLRSRRLEFIPGEIKAGEYAFAVGTAGSAGLVLQTVLPALMVGEQTSTLTLEGGTHNPNSPSFHFLERVFAPRLAEFGPTLSLELHQHGFYPAGGGRFRAVIDPKPRDAFEEVSILERGEQTEGTATALVANLPEHVGNRELGEVSRLMNWPHDQLEVRDVSGPGPGNVVWIELVFERLTEMFTAFGRKGRPAEQVGQDAVDEARSYLSSTAPVGEHLADQLLLPMALAGKGEIVCTAPSMHTTTQIEIIEKFLPVEFIVERLEGDRSWKIVVES